MPTSLLAAALVLDDEGLVTDANALALALLGRPRAQLLGRSFGSVVEGSRPDGTPVRCKTLRSQQMDGTTLCLLREVHGDELVEDLSAYFDAAFDHAPIGMAILGADGRYVRVNDALCAMLGRSRATLMGERDNELTHPDDRARDVELAWRILRGELDSVQLEKRFLRPDGSVVWVISNMTYLRDDTGDQVQRQTKLRGTLAGGRPRRVRRLRPASQGRRTLPRVDHLRTGHRSGRRVAGQRRHGARHLRSQAPRGRARAPGHTRRPHGARQPPSLP